LILYVDDILLASNDKDILHNTKNFLFKNFKVKDLGDVSYVLGIEILWDILQCVLSLSKRNYIENMLKRYDMQNSKSEDTPIAKEINLALISVLKMT
jgi:Reverse transcriptase (RNA-dependent DNA polymerase)